MGASPKGSFSFDRGLGGLMFWFDISSVHVYAWGATGGQHKAAIFLFV